MSPYVSLGLRGGEPSEVWYGLTAVRSIPESIPYIPESIPVVIQRGMHVIACD